MNAEEKLQKIKDLIKNNSESSDYEELHENASDGGNFSDMLETGIDYGCQDLASEIREILNS